MALDNEHRFLDWVSSQGCLVSKIIEPSVKLSPYIHHFAVRVMTFAYGCSPFYLQNCFITNREAHVAIGRAFAELHAASREFTVVHKETYDKIPVWSEKEMVFGS
jgi:Ser/Thr protein kinase RdoA (MazF antagonist)